MVLMVVLNTMSTKNELESVLDCDFKISDMGNLLKLVNSNYIPMVVPQEILSVSNNISMMNFTNSGEPTPKFTKISTSELTGQSLRELGDTSDHMGPPA